MGKKGKSKEKKSKNKAAQIHTPQCCSMPMVATRQLRNLSLDRERLILMSDRKWVNGTQLSYYFFRGSQDGSPQHWAGTNNHMNMVRAAFDTWENLGIGLTFQEVNIKSEAMIRIGFDRSDGAWSYVGRDIVDLELSEHARTMNLGWEDEDTALHEIGHTLGFPHEHQNPNAGIEWNEEEVYRRLALPPNNWSREVTYHNIIRKINPDQIQGSNHDADSIMHYPFGPGMISAPGIFRKGLRPAPGLSARDIEWVKFFYPPMDQRRYNYLQVAQSQSMNIEPGKQKDFFFKPDNSRKYTFQTFGFMDTVMVLFEQDGEVEHYLSGDDDSGTDYNAKIQIRLIKNRTYILRIRLFYNGAAGETAVMVF